MSYFDQYSGIAGGYASQYGIPQPIFFGLIQQESGWNPFAVGDNGAAIGFGQLHAGAASDVGVNRFDPTQNLQGTAAYLSNQFHKYGNWTDALSAFNQGHAGLSAGLSYAKQVLSKAASFMNGGTLADIGAAIAGDPLPLAGDILGNQSCGPICELQKWFDKSHFIERIALAVLALLFVLGGLYLMKGD